MILVQTHLEPSDTDMEASVNNLRQHQKKTPALYWKLLAVWRIGHKQLATNHFLGETLNKMVLDFNESQFPLKLKIPTPLSHQSFLYTNRPFFFHWFFVAFHPKNTKKQKKQQKTLTHPPKKKKTNNNNTSSPPVRRGQVSTTSGGISHLAEKGPSALALRRQLFGGASELSFEEFNSTRWMGRLFGLGLAPPEKKNEKTKQARCFFFGGWKYGHMVYGMIYFTNLFEIFF